MADDVSDIMQDDFDDVPEDIWLPTGEYIFRITGFKVGHQPSEKRTPFVQWSLRPVAVVDSVLNDEDLMNAFPVYDKLWLSRAAKKMARRFFENTLGMSVEGNKNDVLFEAAVGMEVRALVTQKPPSAEGKNPYVKVERYFRNQPQEETEAT